MTGRSQEVWREIDGAPGYFVSNEGRVRSPRRRILRPQSNGRYGYQKVSLGRDRQRYVHRLVAAAFLGDLHAGTEVEHCDGNVANNSVANLAIVTHAENMRLQRKRKPACKRGHLFAVDGGWRANGRRFCRACAVLRESRRNRSVA